MTDLAFPTGFLWGTATAAHQVEGNNTNSDWWAWEHRQDTPCKEPSGDAIDHYNRYGKDVALIAGLGYNTYRFSVEWARIEPSDGVFDETQLEHYRQMVAAVRKSGMIPMVTLNHFTLPEWVAGQGSWLSDKTPALFERYVRRVVEALGDTVDWYCTINEPGIVALCGYLGPIGFPPGVVGYANWDRASKGLIEGHHRALAAVKELRPSAHAGMTHSMSEWLSNAGGRPAMKFARNMGEDRFLAACKEDDFVGVQTYSCTVLEMPRPAGWVTAAVLAVPPLKRMAISRMVNGRAAAENPMMDSREGIRRTQMGYEFRPQAVAATVRRVAEVLPGKPIVVTEHGVATADDAERVEFIGGGLEALHATIADGIPLRGYVHWSAFDNFEWAAGYAMEFGLIAVDRATQKRSPKPSAQFLGDIARANKVVIAAK
jgi:beta-glucosidase